MAPTVDQLVTGYDRRTTAIRGQVTATVRQLWLASPNYRDADIARLTRQIIPLVEGGQLALANLTSAYVRALAVEAGVEAVPVAVDREAVLNGRGVAKAEVYRRPAVEVYRALDQGKSMTEAVKLGTNRLLSITSTDLQMARVRQSRAALSGSGFRYYVRELTGRENCALCAIASTQRYRVRDLMPIHPGCDCGVRAVDADYDPGQVIDQARLDEVHRLVGEQLGFSDSSARYADLGKQVTYSNRHLRGPSPEERFADYTELVVVREHGEVGPTLSWRDHKFTGPSAFDGVAA